MGRTAEFVRKQICGFMPDHVLDCLLAGRYDIQNTTRYFVNFRGAAQWILPPKDRARLIVSDCCESLVKYEAGINTL